MNTKSPILTRLAMLALVPLMSVAACDADYDDLGPVDEIEESDDEFRAAAAAAAADAEVWVATPVECPVLMDDPCGGGGGVVDPCVFGGVREDFSAGDSCKIMMCDDTDWMVCDGSLYESGTCHYAGPMGDCGHKKKKTKGPAPAAGLPSPAP